MAKRLLRSAGYVAFAFLALLLGLYFTFPGDAVAQRLAYELRTQTGGQVTASFGDVSLYRLTGIEAEDVRLLVNTSDPPTPITLDAVRGRLQILPLFLLSLSFATEIELRDGSVAAEISPDDDGALAAEAEIENLDVAKPPILGALAGLPVNGVVNGTVDVRWEPDPRKSSGQVNLQVGNLAVGPGEPVSGFSLPNEVKFGVLDLDLTLESGQFKIGRFAQNNGKGPPDVAIKVATVSANLRRSMSTTSYEACLALKLDEQFLVKNPKFEAVMNLATIPAPVGPGFRKDPDGFLHASVSGTFSGKPKPRRRLCNQKKERPKGRGKNTGRAAPKRPK